MTFEFQPHQPHPSLIPVLRSHKRPRFWDAVHGSFELPPFNSPCNQHPYFNWRLEEPRVLDFYDQETIHRLGLYVPHSRPRSLVEQGRQPIVDQSATASVASEGLDMDGENQKYSDALERAGLYFSPPRSMDLTLQYDASINNGLRYCPGPQAPCLYQPEPQHVGAREYSQASRLQQEAMNPTGPSRSLYWEPHQPFPLQIPSPPLPEGVDMRDPADIGPGERRRYLAEGSTEASWAARPLAHQYFVTHGQHQHR